MEPTRKDIVSVLSDASSQGLKAREIARRLHVRAKDLKSFRRLLDELETEGSIVLGRRRRYYLPSRAGHITGRFSGYGLEVATLIPSDGSPSLTINAGNFSGARHGDMVAARIVNGPDGEKLAQVVKVIEKASAETIGEVYGSGDEKVIGVEPGKRYRRVMFDKKSKAKPGDYVVVKIDTWGEPYEKARGRVSEVLGGKLSPGEDFARIVREHNLPLDFPRDVKREVTKIPDAIPESEVARRENLRGLLTFTIDPEDAKDFDDAISVEKIDTDRFRVGVHIADVSHYVREGSRLDNEALARGRSVYLVDRVIPMLPDKLSGDLASLRPEEERLTLSVFMELDRGGGLLSYEIKESVIRSDMRLTYDEAQNLIEKRFRWRASRTVKKVSEALKYANFIARALNDKRKARGAIEMETSEVDIKVDATGRTVEIRPGKRLESHRLIEELMILANEIVAEHMSYMGRMFIYRVHEVPDEDDMRDLSVFADGFGHRFRWTKGVSPHALQALLERAKGRPEELIISMYLLRSLKKAVYSERNVGHFGLASRCYTHFTSPIRRYPDLVVHRLLKRYGIKKLSPRDTDGLLRFVKRASSVATAREIEGDEAERAAIKARVCEFMEQRIGEEYRGTISGILDFGFFVILDENLAEGLVHVSTLGKDYYTLDRTKTALFGTRTGTQFSVGDRVKVKVVRVDRMKREIDFMLLAREGREGEMPFYTEPKRKAKRREIFKRTEEGAKRAKAVRARRDAKEERSERRAATPKGKGGVRPGRGRKPRPGAKPGKKAAAKPEGQKRRKTEYRAGAKDEAGTKARTKARAGGGTRAGTNEKAGSETGNKPRRGRHRDSGKSAGDRRKQSRRSGRPRRPRGGNSGSAKVNKP